MARTIVVVSGKGGVGKTTVTANLGRALAARGRRVTLVDADIGLNNLDVALDLEDRVVYDILDVADGRIEPAEALVSDKDYPDLKLLPSVKCGVSDKIKAARFAAIASVLNMTSDYLIIDAPAGVENGFHRAVCAAKEALVITTPHLSAVKDADRTARLLYTYDVKSVGLVVNRVRYDLTDRGEAVAPEKIAELMRLKLVGALPESDVIGINVVCGEKGESAKAYACLADFIEGKSDKIYSPDTGRGLFSLFKRRWQ